MHNETPGRRILLAEDDEDDFVLIRDVLEGIDLVQDLRWVQDGEELLDYLQRRGAYADPSESPPPDLILLDLNMPKKDGRSALREMKAAAHLRRIPVVVLTTSDSERDILTSYDLGANSYVIKPNSFGAFRSLMGQVTGYWFGIVCLPPPVERPPDAKV